jgi:hypothetical protein
MHNFAAPAWVCKWKNLLLGKSVGKHVLRLAQARVPMLFKQHTRRGTHIIISFYVFRTFIRGWYGVICDFAALNACLAPKLPSRLQLIKICEEELYSMQLIKICEEEFRAANNDAMVFFKQSRYSFIYCHTLKGVIKVD